MNQIKSVLAEELANSLRLKKQYGQALQQLPKGSLVAKKIKRQIYYYLAERQGEKVVFHYMGKMPESELEKHRQGKVLKAKYRKLLSDLDKQIVFLRRALRERK